MPKGNELQTNVTYVDSVFDSDIARRNEAEMTRHLDNLLKTFSSGMSNSPEGQTALEFFGNGQISGYWAGYIVSDSLKRIGLSSEAPSVADVIELGNRLIVMGDDGKPTTFSAKYFNNDTVKALYDQEQSEKGPRNKGAVLAAFMGAYLAESENPDIENYKTAFGDKGIDKCPAYIVSKDGNTVTPILGKDVVREYANMVENHLDNDLRDKLTSDMEKAKEEYTKAVDEHAAAHDDYRKAAADFDAKYPEPPVVPPAPREKNAFRRFFAAIKFVKHSDEYNAAMKEYRSKSALKRQYDVDLKELQTKLELTDSKGKTLKKASLDQEYSIAKFNDGIEDMNDRFQKNESVRMVSSTFDALPEIKLFAKHSHEENVRNKIINCFNDKEKIEEFALSNAMSFGEEGGMEAMVDLIKLKRKNNILKLVGDVMTSNAPDMVADTIEAANKIQFKNRNKKREYVETQLYRKYKANVQSSKLKFQTIFGMPPTPDNLQKVADTLGLDEQVAKRITTNADSEKPDRFKLPEINKYNADDMCHLIMMGVKTVAIEGGIAMGKGKFEYVYSDKPSEVSSGGEVKETSLTKLNKRFGEKKAENHIHKLPEGEKSAAKEAGKAAEKKEAAPMQRNGS